MISQAIELDKQQQNYGEKTVLNRLLEHQFNPNKQDLVSYLKVKQNTAALSIIEAALKEQEAIKHKFTDKIQKNSSKEIVLEKPQINQNKDSSFAKKISGKGQGKEITQVGIKPKDITEQKSMLMMG